MSQTEPLITTASAAPAPDVEYVRVLDDHQLLVSLTDGRTGTLDLTWLLGAPAYSALNDPAYVRRARVEWGTVTWPNGEDLSPESISLRLQPAAGGVGVPSALSSSPSTDRRSGA